MSDGRGQFITFEGPEGGGKTTQIERLRERLQEHGVPTLQTREPGGTTVGRELRAMLLEPDRPPLAPATQALLVSADRAQHVAEVILPALQAGTVVISDRYADSMLVYQGAGAGVDPASLAALTALATGGLVPDLTVLIDVDVQVGLRRRAVAFRTGHGELNRIDRSSLDYHQRVRDGYLALAQGEPDRFVTIDGLQAVDAVASHIWQRVSALLGLKTG